MISVSKNKCGIYCLRNILDGKMYLGGSQEIRSRLLSHLRLLRNGQHNKRFQAAYDAVGKENFEVFQLIDCAEQDLELYEQLALDLYQTFKPENGYNIISTAHRKKHSNATRTKIGKAHIGRIVSEETRILIGKQSKARADVGFSESHRHKISVANTGKRHSEETKQHLSQVLKGRVKSKAHIEKQRESLKRRWQDPEFKALMSAKYKAGWAKKKAKANV